MIMYVVFALYIFGFVSIIFFILLFSLFLVTAFPICFVNVIPNFVISSFCSLFMMKYLLAFPCFFFIILLKSFEFLTIFCYFIDTSIIKNPLFLVDYYFDNLFLPFLLLELIIPDFIREKKPCFFFILLLFG